ncbi:hypothetical protein M413DRAFT_13072 [Hebeloma cylindrosporum]|uniref:Uncharacterized protein n=1 Tax=Hebeloma cylindrosporum TaxID=76867 RepID=A0A0C3C0R7_HEBCY|nr:hypothetical protein M413DRAFT_13072 [Hebeloma cylindrosporum h7]
MESHLEADDDLSKSQALGNDIAQNCLIHGGTPPQVENPLCAKCTNHVSQLRAPLVSPLEHLLSDTVRHVPSHSEELEIRGVIRNAEERIAEIDSTSKRIRLLLDHLGEERRTIQQFADKHRVMVAPVLEIPPEILSHIFILTLPNRVEWHEIKRSSLKRSMTLARVNRHWRNVAVSTPQLWTTILIDEKSFPKLDVAHDAEEICMPKLFLQRSGMCPLSLSVHTKEYNEEILATVVPLAERWHRITLDTPMRMLVSLSPIYNRLPLLRTLEFKTTHWTIGTNPNHLTFFSNAPLLRYLILSCHYVGEFDVLPLHQLTRWDSPIGVAAIPKIFELAPNLEECFFQPSRLISSVPIPENPTAVAHKLTSLHISAEGVGGTNYQFQHLPHLPSLRRLFIYFDKRVGLSGASILPLFVKSGGQLEYLMWGLGAPLRTIVECLKHTPLVTTLQFHRITNDRLLGYLVAPNKEGQVLLPKLEVLRLSGKLPFKVPPLLEVIRSRWKSPTKNEASATSAPEHPRSLKSVLILPAGTEKFESQRKKQLVALSEEGFDKGVSEPYPIPSSGRRVFPS